MNNLITAITVCYNSKELFERAYNSVRKFHPGMKIIIVDGSDRKDLCRQYVLSLASSNNLILQPFYNIGHGRGINLALSRVETPYVLIFDSDIEMLKSPIQSMLDMMEDDTYGVGYIEKTDLGGFDFGARPDQMKYGSMRYLHPYFCLIQLKEYRKYAPFIHHGAPAVNTCLDIYNRGLSDKVIKEFPGLGHSSGTGFSWTSEPREFVLHNTAGTRTARREKGLLEIEGAWENTIGRGKVTCITPTGDRLEAFELTKRWIASQTTQPFQWIVVDDGFDPLPDHLKGGIDYIRREPSKGEGHTLVENLRTSLPYIKGDKVLIIEDDDWYGPNYIRTMSGYLDNYDLVGEGFARYYHLPTGQCQRIPNQKHVSLCQTGFNISLLPTFERVLPGDPYIDARFWDAVKTNKLVFLDSNNKLHLHCSMKGLKGRKGIGTGHTPDRYYLLDRELKTLIEWVGEENAQLYMDHIGQSMESAKAIIRTQKGPHKITWRDKLKGLDRLTIKQTFGVAV